LTLLLPGFGAAGVCARVALAQVALNTKVRRDANFMAIRGGRPDRVKTCAAM
jgi:hypothetical protein